MAIGYWLINSNKSEVKIVTEKIDNKDQFYKNFIVYSRKIFGYLVKEPPLLKTREVFKLYEAREIWKKLTSQGWRRTRVFEDGAKQIRQNVCDDSFLT